MTGRASDFPTFGPRKGQAGVQEFFTLVGSNLDFSEFSPKEFYAVGDKVFVLGHYAMTVKKTGKAMASDWVHIFTVAGGKVTDVPRVPRHGARGCGSLSRLIDAACQRTPHQPRMAPWISSTPSQWPPSIRVSACLAPWKA